MQQLSGQDAMFLYMETLKTPMHLGGVYIFAPPENGQFNFNEFKEILSSRLHLSRIFRQRLVEVPLEMGHPYWVEDPDFDIEYHMTHVAIPKPGDMEALMKLSSHLLSRTMDRQHPLWRIIIAEGLDNAGDIAPPGSFAMISMVHHAAIDGGSGAEIMGAILDMGPIPRQEKQPKKPWKPERIPTGLELAARSYGKVITSPFKLLGLVKDTVGGALDVASEILKNKENPPPFPFTAPKTLFNVQISHHRIFRGIEIPLSKVKALKNAVEGTTVNDVMLTICGGGLRKYLLGKNALPNKPLVAMAPISVRSDKAKKSMGNQVSAMLVSLETTVEDPVERLEYIHQSARSSKNYGTALSADKLMELVPSELAALSARLYTRTHIAELANPVFNLVITNVPGPPIPLYMSGAQMLHHYGMAPLMDGLGLLIVIFSYAGRVSLGVISCREIMPDIDDFMQFLEESVNEMEEALLPPPEPQPAAKPKRKSTRKTASSKTQSKSTVKTKTNQKR